MGRATATRTATHQGHHRDRRCRDRRHQRRLIWATCRPIRSLAGRPAAGPAGLSGLAAGSAGAGAETGDEGAPSAGAEGDAGCVCAHRNTAALVLPGAGLPRADRRPSAGSSIDSLHASILNRDGNWKWQSP